MSAENEALIHDVKIAFKAHMKSNKKTKATVAVFYGFLLSLGALKTTEDCLEIHETIRSAMWPMFAAESIDNIRRLISIKKLAWELHDQIKKDQSA